MNRLIDFLVFIDRIFAKTLEILLIVALVTMTFLVASQVILRNFFSSGIQWADVASRHIVLWVTFLGAMLATRARGHLSIDAFTRFIPRIPRNAVRIALDALACAVSLLLANASFNFVMDERATGSWLFTGVPAWLAQAIIPFGFAMISLEYAIGIGLDIWRIAKHGSSHVAGKGRA